MRHVKMLGLCLVAVLAVAAVGASSALAGPRWGKCTNVGTGRYTDSNCTQRARPANPGQYEWETLPLGGQPFTSHNAGGSASVLSAELWECTTEKQRVTRQTCATTNSGVYVDSTTRVEVECAAETDTGTAEGTNRITNLLVTFTGCKLLSDGPCQNGSPGEIKLNPLRGKLGWINKAQKEVGVLFEPVAGNGGRFAVFNCGPLLRW